MRNVEGKSEKPKIASRSISTRKSSESFSQKSQIDQTKIGELGGINLRIIVNTKKIFSCFQLKELLAYDYQ